MPNLLWLQGGCCGGESVSLLNSEEPGILNFFEKFNINLLWHPFLSLQGENEVLKLLAGIKEGKVKLDILVVEGAIYQGPERSGKYTMLGGMPFKKWVKTLARYTEYLVAVGTCSSFGGIATAGENMMQATGIQFLKDRKGGFWGRTTDPELVYRLSTSPDVQLIRTGL